MISVPIPALARLQLQPVADVFATEQSQIVRGIVVFFVSLVVVYAVARFVLLRVVLRVMQSRNVESSIVSLGRLVGQVVSAFIAFGIAFALAGFGSILTALAALSGAITIAVGLAANDIIANLLAGLYIINERLFRVGDWIEWSDPPAWRCRVPTTRTPSPVRCRPLPVGRAPLAPSANRRRATCSGRSARGAGG